MRHRKAERISSKVKRASAVIVASVMLTACGGPMSEGLRPAAGAQDAKAQATDSKKEKKEPEGVITLDMTDLSDSTATADDGPFSRNPRMEEIILSITGTDLEKVKEFHTRFRADGPEGVKAYSRKNKPPRTATEAFEKGGDCTDLANLAIAGLKAMGIPGGAMVVHFDDQPEEEDHMVAYALIEGKRIIVDLQADRLGKTADGSYTVKLEMDDFEKATAVYHTENGDFYRAQKDPEEAIEAYEKALTYFDKDPLVHYNIGKLYGLRGDSELGQKHQRRAAELDPKRFGKHERRLSYNEEIKAANKAYKEQRWLDCAQHYSNALQSGEKLTDEEERLLRANVKACRKNHMITSGPPAPLAY